MRSWEIELASYKDTVFLDITDHTSGLGDHSLTTGSMPEVARRQLVGCGCKQFTIESSPLNTRTIFVVAFSQIKNDPSSEPATTY